MSVPKNGSNLTYEACHKAQEQKQKKVGVERRSVSSSSVLFDDLFDSSGIRLSVMFIRSTDLNGHWTNHCQQCRKLNQVDYNLVRIRICCDIVLYVQFLIVHL